MPMRSLSQRNLETEIEVIIQDCFLNRLGFPSKEMGDPPPFVRCAEVAEKEM